MSAFDKKKFTKPRAYSSVKGHHGISRLWVWNDDCKRYCEPSRGKKFLATRYSISNNRRLREKKFFSNLEDARNWQAGEEFKADIVPPNGKTLADVINDWKTIHWPNLSESTRIFHEKNIPAFDSIAGLTIEVLTPKLIDTWILELKSPSKLKTYKKSRLSLDKEFETLQTVINWYIGMTDDPIVSPIKKRHRAMLQIREKETQKQSFMSLEEYNQWLEALRTIDFQFYALALVQTRQLLRVSEVCAMKWSNLNLKERSYRLCEHVIWPRVGGAPHRIVGGTKTIKAGDFNMLYLRQDVVDVLTKLYENRSSDLVFHDEGQILTYRQVQHRYNQGFKAAKLPYSSTHVCRHTGATAFLEETGDPLALQQMGCWKDQKMALHYGKILATRAKAAIDKAEKKEAESA